MQLSTQPVPMELWHQPQNNHERGIEAMLVWTDSIGRVTRVHYKPETLSKEKREGGVFIDSMPDAPEVDIGERPVLYLNGSTLSWSVEPRELTSDEKVQVLQEKIDALVSVAEKKSLLTDKEVETEISTLRKRT